MLTFSENRHCSTLDGVIYNFHRLDSATRALKHCMAFYGGHRLGIISEFKDDFVDVARRDEFKINKKVDRTGIVFAEIWGSAGVDLNSLYAGPSSKTNSGRQASLQWFLPAKTE